MENAQLRGGNPAPTSPPPPHPSSSSSSSSSDEELSRLRAELTTSTRRCTLLEQDLQRIRSQQQQPVKAEPTEDELSSVGSESPLIAPSSCGSTVEEKENQSSRGGLMMALLLLLAPVLTPSSSSSSQQQQQQHEQTFFHEHPYGGEPHNFHLPNRFDSFGIFDTTSPSTTTSLAFDHLLPPTPSTSTSPSSASSFPSSLTFPSAPSPGKREVELDVQLTRDVLNPDRVKVKLLSPTTPSSPSLSFPPTPPTTMSDFLPLPLDFGSLQIGCGTPGLGLSGLPSTYSYSIGGGMGSEKKRVKIAVSGEDSGEWEVEVKN